MNFRDQVRNQVYAKEALERKQLSHANEFNLDQICEDCLRAEVDRVIEWILNEGMQRGKIVYENGQKVYRIELHFEHMRYMYISEDLRRYFDRLDLPKKHTFTSNSGLYQLVYEKDRYMIDDSWEIGPTRSNTNSEMKVQTRKQKVGFFGSNYKYEWKVDTCYNLDRYMRWFKEKARMEGMQVTFHPYLAVLVNKGLRNENYYKTLPSFNEWHEYNGSEYVQQIGVMIQIDVDL